ncbi:MAG: cell division protein FtsA [Candidatus Omnitrophota bacterium]
MPREDLIASLDIGASKICCLIGTLSKKNDSLDVLGFGVAHHDSLRHGVAVDIKGLSEAIGLAVFRAEEACGKKVQSVFFNISGIHVKGFPAQGEVLIDANDNEITKEDIEKVLDNAKSMYMHYERDVVHLIEREFYVDGEGGIVDPKGMFGSKLAADIYIVTAKISLIDNIKKVIRQAGLTIEGYFLSGIATSSCLVSKNERQLGVVMVDIGADITEIVVFLEGKVSFVKILPIGGDEITRTIAEKLRISEGIAERIKIEKGNLSVAGSDSGIVVFSNSQETVISEKEFKDVLFCAYEELFSEIENAINLSGLSQYASSGIVLYGQTVLLEGVLEVAQLVFSLPVRLADSFSVDNLESDFSASIFATSYGLMKEGQDFRKKRKKLTRIVPKNLVLKLVDKGRALYKEYF